MRQIRVYLEEYDYTVDVKFDTRMEFGDWLVIRSGIDTYAWPRTEVKRVETEEQGDEHD